MYEALSRASVVIELIEDVEQYEAVVVSTNGVILQPYDTSTTLIGTVLKNKVDITNKIENVRWTKWNPTKDNLLECPEWNEQHIGMSTIEVTKNDVDSKSIFAFEAYNSLGQLLCTASICVIDINDLLVSTDEPKNPYVGQLWVDDSKEPATLYVWNGFKWVIAGSVGAIVKNLLKNSSFMFNTQYWDIVGDSRLSYAPYGIDHLGHRFVKLASDVVTDLNRGISQTTTDIIATKSEYSFQMIFYSVESTQTYSNNITVNINSIDSKGDKTTICTKTVSAEKDMKRMFLTFKTLSDTKDLQVEILGEADYRYNFYVGELALYNTWNDYPWTINPIDLKFSADYTQEELWNILSNNGKIQGIFTRINPETGQLEYYINASYIGAGKMKAEFMEMYGLKVLRKDDDGNPDNDVVTFEITENGDVNLNVTQLIIGSTGQTIEETFDGINEKINSVQQVITPEGLTTIVTAVATDENGEITKHIYSIAEQTAEGFYKKVTDETDGKFTEVKQTVDEIEQRVSNGEDRMSEIEQTADKLASRVKDGEDKMSAIEQAAGKIELRVEDAEKSIGSLIDITAAGIYLSSNGSLVDINGNGVSITADNVTVDASNIHLEGYTTINGGFAVDKEGNMTANNGKFNGTITSSTIETTKIVAPNIVSDETEDPKFSLTSDGTLTAREAIIKGQMSGTIVTGDTFMSSNKKFAVLANGTLECEDANIKGSIKAGSTITGTKINGGSIIGTTIKNAETNPSFIVSSEGVVTGATIHGGSIGIGGTNYNAFTVDNNGNCNITKGSIKIGNNFSVSNTGELTATSANFTGSINSGSNITGASISGGTISIGNGNFVVDKDGILTAKGAKIDGKMDATTGYIAGFKVSDNTLTATNVGINSSSSNSAIAFWAGSDTAGSAPFRVSNSGKLTANDVSITGGTLDINNGNFHVDSNGVLTAKSGNFHGDITSGSTITGATIKNSSGTFKVDANGNITGAAISGSTITGTTINGGTLTIGDNFKVVESGALTAKSANITGTITAKEGSIGGYTIGEHKLTATNVGMCSNSSVEWAFWAGANNGVDAPFHVGHNGYLYASNATITGNITATSGSFTGTITAKQGEIGGFTINETTLKGTNVGLCSSTGEWAFWAGASTGGASAFHVGHDGKLYSSSANISGSISGSTITASSFSDPNNFFVVDSDGTVIAQSIDIKGEVSAETVVGEYLAIPWYSKSLTKNMTCYIRSGYSYPVDENDEVDVNRILEDGIYASFDDLQDYVPRNLNGYTLTINFESDITDQLNIDNFCNGTVRIAFNGHTLKGNIRAIGRSFEILIYGNKPGSTKGTIRGKIVPGKNGYLYNDYTYCIVGDKCRITVYDIDLYAGTTATSSDMIGNNGICCTNGAVGYLSAIKAVNEPYALVRCHSTSHVYVESSSGRTKDCTFHAVSGSIMHLNDTTQAGTTGSKGTIYTKDNAKIFADGVKYDTNTPVVDPTPVEPPKSTTVTVTKTIKSTAGRSWRTSGNYANSWSSESVVRQGQWTTGNGKNKGYWFFGNDIYNILQNSKNTITSMTVKITRNSGGANAAVTHYLRAHTISSKPSGAPSDYLGTSTLNKKFSLAVGSSTTLSLSSTEIANLKSSKAKGFGLYNSDFTTGKNGPYSCCSSSCTVVIKYKTTET